VRATAAKQIGILINGIPGHPVENLTLENIDIELTGGGTSEQAAVQLAEKEAAYPEITTFGRVMPVYGIYARHVNGIRFNQVHVRVINPDARPAVALIDVANITPAGFGSEPPPSAK
jgi:hypothetical protein